METHKITHADSVEERRSRERRIWQQGFGISVALHILLFLIFSTGGGPVSPFSAAGPDNRDDQAAEGALEVVQMRAAPPQEIIPPPEIDIVDLFVEVEEPDLAPDLDIDVPQPDVPDPGVGDSDGDDPADDGRDVGLPEATGAGDGGQSEEGLTRVTPPTPRGLIIPPTDDDLRGREIEVWVFVNELGRVEADSTRLEPPTANRRYNQQLIREANQWIFNPARRAGEAVAAWFPYKVAM